MSGSPDSDGGYAPCGQVPFLPVGDSIFYPEDVISLDCREEGEEVRREKNLPTVSICLEKALPEPAFLRLVFLPGNPLPGLPHRDPYFGQAALFQSDRSAAGDAVQWEKLFEKEEVAD